jgi:hypothetical protein
VKVCATLRNAGTSNKQWDATVTDNNYAATRTSWLRFVAIRRAKRALRRHLRLRHDWDAAVYVEPPQSAFYRQMAATVAPAPETREQWLCRGANEGWISHGRANQVERAW